MEEISVELWKDLLFDEKRSNDEMRKNGRNKSCSKDSEITNYKSSSFEFKSKNLSREISFGVQICKTKLKRNEVSYNHLFNVQSALTHETFKKFLFASKLKRFLGKF